MRIKLLLVLAVSVLMCGTVVADPVMPTGWTCSGFTAQTCGFAADWVSGLNPGILEGDSGFDYSDYRAGAVMFRITGPGLFEVWLSNISDLDIDETNYLLTAVIFNIGDGTTDNANLVNLTKVSATLASGATIGYLPCDPGPCDGSTTDMGSEWAYKKLTTDYPDGPGGVGDSSISGGPRYGISSVGLDLFGPGDRFNTKKGSLDSPDSPNGSNFGITSLGDNPATANGGMENDPVIKPSGVNGGVVFRFTYTGNLDVSQINNVLLQYGTSLGAFTWPDCVVLNPEDAINARAEENCVPVCEDCGGNEVPEPASLILVGSGFLGLAGFLRRKLT